MCPRGHPEPPLAMPTIAYYEVSSNRNNNIVNFLIHTALANVGFENTDELTATISWKAWVTLWFQPRFMNNVVRSLVTLRFMDGRIIEFVLAGPHLMMCQLGAYTVIIYAL